MKKVFAVLFISLVLVAFACHADQTIFSPHTSETVSPDLVGGKTSNLLLLQKIPGISVPRWFCVSTTAFQEYLVDNELGKLIAELDKACVNFKENEKKIGELSGTIQKKILHGTIRDKVQEQIGASYRSLGNVAVAVRSSGVLEDTSHASFAGLYDTCLNRRGSEDVVVAIKQVWASTFSPRIVTERARAGIRQEHCSIAVVVQEMIHAKAAGVAASIELSSNYPGVEISANYGTGETVVSGEVSVDKWLVHPEQNYIIKAVLGSKTSQSVLDEVSGTVERATPEEKQKKFSLTNEQVLQVAHSLRRIRSYYSTEIDVEFAFDEKGDLYFLQTRPLVAVAPKFLAVDPEDAKNHAHLAAGNYSVPGVATGRLKFIDNWEDLANKTITIEPDDIVVAYVALNFWSHYLTQFKGLITKQGGPTTHPILLCRERNVPCLIGIDHDFENLRNYVGKVVTLDAIGQVVYEGEVRVKENSQNLKSFEPVQVRPWKSFEDRIFELKQGGFIFERDNLYWLKQPTSPHRKLMQEIHLKRAERLPHLIQGHTDYKIEARVIDNYVCSVVQPAEQYVSCFNGMTLEECERLNQNQEKNLQEFVRIAQNFTLDPELWQKYVDTLSDLRTYTWIVEIFRMYTDRQAEIVSSSLAVPQYYFDECSSYIQSQLPEEDTFMQKALYELASKMCTSEINTSEINALAHYYRFGRSTPLEKELDLNMVYKRLNEEIDQIKKGKVFHTQKKVLAPHIYFPEHSSLYRWLYLSINNRVLQSNSHHVVARHQWKIREALLQLGAYATAVGKLNQQDDIFDCTPEEVKELIVAWKEKGQ